MKGVPFIQPLPDQVTDAKHTFDSPQVLVGSPDSGYQRTINLRSNRTRLATSFLWFASNYAAIPSTIQGICVDALLHIASGALSCALYGTLYTAGHFGIAIGLLALVTGVFTLTWVTVAEADKTLLPAFILRIAYILVGACLGI